MAGRLKNLQAGVDIVAAGNYETKVPITSRDELGGLGAAFNTMAGALKSSRDQLEERVASRTGDLTEANLQLKRLNRVYAVLSGINALSVRVRDRDELFREACRFAVEQGQFKMASIGVVDRATMQVRPAAWAGPLGRLPRRGAAAAFPCGAMRPKEKARRRRRSGKKGRS